jgi:hypothetical protein
MCNCKLTDARVENHVIMIMMLMHVVMKACQLSTSISISLPEALATSFICRHKLDYDTGERAARAQQT